MRITRTDEYERIIDNSPIAQSFERRINAHYNDNRQSVQEYVNTLIDKAGMTEYIKQVNSELETSNKKQAAEKIKSILDIPDIKDAIDEALDNKRYLKPILLLVQLQELVKSDSRIPENLKDVIGNKDVRDYIVKKMGYKDSEDVKYELGKNNESLTNSSDKDNSNSSYFSFEKNENK